MARSRFTIEEADALVPVLALEVGEVLKARERASEAAGRLGGMERALQIARGALVARDDEGAALAFARATGELAAAVERINALGCLVEDLEHGVVDIPSERDGQSVMLCWQFGEPRVGYYHGAEESIAQRQAISGASGHEESQLH